MAGLGRIVGGSGKEPSRDGSYFGGSKKGKIVVGGGGVEWCVCVCVYLRFFLFLSPTHLHTS